MTVMEYSSYFAAPPVIALNLLIQIPDVVMPWKLNALLCSQLKMRSCILQFTASIFGSKLHNFMWNNFQSFHIKLKKEWLSR